MAERKPFLLRLPPDLMDVLNTWAHNELRSLNSQIEYVLREAVRRRAGGRIPPPDADVEAGSKSEGGSRSDAKDNSSENSERSAPGPS